MKNAPLEPSEIKSILKEAVRTRSTKARRALFLRVVDAFTALNLPDDQTKASVLASAGALEKAIFSGRSSKEREKAAMGLAREYEAGYQLAASGSSGASGQKWRYGGRSGQVPVSTDETVSDNERLDELLRTELKGRKIAPPKFIWPDDDANLSCGPIVTVSKPGGLKDLKEAGFDPAFLQYLKRNDQLALRTYEEWLAENELDPSAQNRRHYEEAMAKAYERFEKERDEGRYCRPRDIPAPGIFHGRRMLRIDCPITETEFASYAGQNGIYEGPQGAPVPPELDYEELVRRYVNNLRTQAISYYDLSVSSPEVAVLHRQDIYPFDPLIHRMFLVASMVALQNPDGILKILRVIHIGLPFTATGRRPEEIRAWLRDGGDGFRDWVIDIWKGILRGLAQPGSQTTPAGRDFLPVTEFQMRFDRLCQPWDNNENPPYGGLHRKSGFYQELMDRALAGEISENDFEQLILNEIEDLAAVYNRLWTQARQSIGAETLLNMRQDIQLSGYEARAYLLTLGCITPFAMLTGRRSPYYQLSRTIRDASGFLWNVIQQELTDGKLQISPFEILGAVPADPPNFNLLNNSPNRQGAGQAVVDSYTACHDVVLSLLSSGRAGQTSPSSSGQTSAITEADLPELYDRWVVSFTRVLKSQYEERETIGDNLLILRLTTRTGRYGEVPQRTQAQELAAEPKMQVPPEHPSRRTERYWLEPVPEPYFRAHHPTLYLGEEYSVGIYHRAYGIGANIYSLSLLPEEEQTIVMKSFKGTKTKVSESTAENIFEEQTSETASDFASEVANENQLESTGQEQFNIAGKASASYLFASMSIDSSYGAQSSSRDFAKNTSSVTNRLANKASSKRTVTIDTKRTRETETELHSELSTERKIRNPNLGHTVTFNWFQMTRKYDQVISLEDAKLVYTSGKHNIIRVYKKGRMPNLGPRAGLSPGMIAEMPEDVARRLPPNAAIVVVSEPYTEIIPMAGANAFLARTFTPAKAVVLNARLWQVLGYGAQAPEGLGIVAFPGYRGTASAQDPHVPLYNPNPHHAGDPADPATVAADEVVVRPVGGQNVRVYLPNLDLRYKVKDGLVPARYVADPHNTYSLPRVMSIEERVVNTNGVFCDAMVGRCSALEDYLQRHRDLDLLEKKVQVGQQEIEFRWALAKDGLVEIFEDENNDLTAVVKEKEGVDAFKERLEAERSRLEELKAIRDERLEKQKLEAELDYQVERVNELKRRIELMGTPPELRIDAPEGATVEVNADVDLRSEGDGSRGGGITIE